MRSIIIDRKVYPFLPGDDPVRIWIDSMLRFFSYNYENDEVYIGEGLPEPIIHDYTRMNHFRALTIWSAHDEQIFYIPKDFYTVLDQISLNISPAYLKPTHVFFLLPSNTVKDQDGDYYDGCYVNIRRRGGIWILHFVFENEAGVLRFMAIEITDTEKNIDDAIYRLVTSTPEEKALIIKKATGDYIPPRTDGEDNSTKEDLRSIINGVMNAAIYLNSENMIQLRVNPTPKPPKTGKKGSTYWNRTGHVVAVLNHEYHLPERIFHMDKTTVHMHPRWQPCGPERSRVKLIWVKEHERHYHKDILDKKEE